MEPPYIPKDVHPEAYQNYQEIVEKLQRECKGEFKDINAFTDHINHGLDSLKELICKRIAGLKIAKNDVEAVQHMISTQVLLWPHFQNAIDQVVEVWGLIWAYRTDGEIAWSLKVIWGESSQPFSIDGGQDVSTNMLVNKAEAIQTLIARNLQQASFHIMATRFTSTTSALGPLDMST